MEQFDFIDEQERRWIKLVPKPSLNFSFHLTDACNLNCAGCYHFSPLATRSEYADIEEFDKDLEQLKLIMHDDITVVTLFGGEPLLHKEAYKFPYIVKKHFPMAQVDFITNGILLPQMESRFWQSCMDNDVVIEWTRYPIGDEINSRIESELIAQKCNYRIFNGEGEKTLGHFVIDPNALGKNGQKQRNDARWQFLHCDKATNCVQLKEHKLYPCSIAANAHLFIDYFKLNMRISENDGIDIYKANNKNDITTFLAKPIPFCRYCNVNKQTYGNDFKISKKMIEEWT